MEANLFSLVDATDRNRIFAWGMEIIDAERTDAIVYRRDPETGRTFVGQHTSAESALERYGRRVPLALVWDYDEVLEAFGVGQDVDGLDDPGRAVDQRPAGHRRAPERVAVKGEPAPPAAGVTGCGQSPADGSPSPSRRSAR